MFEWVWNFVRCLRLFRPKIEAIFAPRDTRDLFKSAGVPIQSTIANPAEEIASRIDRGIIKRPLKLVVVGRRCPKDLSPCCVIVVVVSCRRGRAIDDRAPRFLFRGATKANDVAVLHKRKVTKVWLCQCVCVCMCACKFVVWEWGSQGICALMMLVDKSSIAQEDRPTVNVQICEWGIGRASEVVCGVLCMFILPARKHVCWRYVRSYISVTTPTQQQQCAVCNSFVMTRASLYNVCETDICDE